MSGRSPASQGRAAAADAVEPISVVSSKASIPNAWPLFGYAPGSYMGCCRACGQECDNVDKRASQCLECAVREAKAAIEMLSAREVALVAQGDAMRSLLVYLASDTHDVKPEAVRTLAKNALAVGAAETPNPHDQNTRESSDE